MKPLILYHAVCWDGFCAAWIARKALGVDCDFVPVQYGQEPSIGYCGRNVYILDFSYPRAMMKNIIMQSEFVCVLDHHKTAQAELDSLADEIAREGGAWEPVIRFDMNKSGGRLAWEYFFQRTEPCDPAPWLVDYTEDRDLWRHALPNTREINSALRSYPLNFELWDTWTEMTKDDRTPLLMRFADEGSAILRREKQIIDQHVSFAYETMIDGHSINAVNATVLSSEIAGELAKGKPFGACYFVQANGKEVWSLRSTPDGVDVSEIAKRRGGGGHKHAAGFTI